MSYFAKYYLTGRDAQKAVDWIFTANMQKPKGVVSIHILYAHVKPDSYGAICHVRVAIYN